MIRPAMRIITCSNSAARISQVDGVADLVPASPGGVVPMVAALMRRYGGDWLFVVDESNPPPAQTVTVDGVTTRLHPVPVGAAAAEGHHGQFSIRALQWTLHYLHEKIESPLFDRRMWASWDAYMFVNRLMATRMRDVATANSASSAVLGLVNDHQFLLAPEFLRGSGTDWPGPLVYFHQLPWCEADYFAMLPAAVRVRILRSLLRCDVIGFHARRWAEAFLQCCSRFLPNVSVTTDRITGPETTTRVVVAPGPVDEKALARMRNDSLTDYWRSELTRKAGGRRLLVRAERFDLWKNVRRGLLAFEDVLTQSPAISTETWFCALLSRPRRPTERHRADETACEAIAARINERFGRQGRPAVSLLYGQPGANSQHRVIAALELAAATLVNPTFDGLNLVATESLLLAPRTPVVLSINAGAYELLGGHTIGVDPFDTRDTSEAISRALVSTPPPIPAAAANPTRSAGRWREALLVR